MQKVQTKSRDAETKLAPKAKKIKGKDASDNAPEKESKAPRYAKKSIPAVANDFDDFPSDH